MSYIRFFVCLLTMSILTIPMFGQNILNGDFESGTMLLDINGDGTITYKENYPAPVGMHIIPPIQRIDHWKNPTAGPGFGSADFFAADEYPLVSGDQAWGAFEEWIPAMGSYVWTPMQDNTSGHNVFMGFLTNTQANEAIAQCDLDIPDCEKTVEIYAAMRRDDDHPSWFAPDPQFTMYFFDVNITGDYSAFTPVYQEEFTVTGVPGNWSKYETAPFNQPFKTIVIAGSSEGVAPNFTSNYIYVDDVKLNYITSSEPNTIYQQNTTYGSGTNTVFEACKVLNAGEDVTSSVPNGTVQVAPGSDIQYIAGNHINLFEGFCAEPGTNFIAFIDEECVCLPDVEANAGSDLLICSSPLEAGLIGTGPCIPGVSYQWTASPASAASWIVSPTQCISPVVPPFGVDQTVTFTLTATGPNGDVAFDEVEVTAMDGGCDWIRSAGVEEPQEPIIEEKAWEVFPNPNQGVFVLRAKGFPEDARVDVLDVHGRIVLSKQITNSNNRIDISAEKTGIYTVRLTTSTEVFTERVIKN